MRSQPQILENESETRCLFDRLSLDYAELVSLRVDLDELRVKVMIEILETSLIHDNSIEPIPRALGPTPPRHYRRDLRCQCGDAAPRFTI